MVEVLVETEVFVVRCQTVHVVLVDVEQAVYEWASASQVGHSFVAAFVEHFHILLAVGKQAYIRTALEFEDAFSVEL